MRVRLNIDDDVLNAAKVLAAERKADLGAVITGLARSGLESAGFGVRTRNGVPLLRMRAGNQRITPGLVRRLREELP